MPDEFGGVEIDETETDEFGGVAVAEKQETQFSPIIDVPRSSEELAQRNYETQQSLRQSGLLGPPTPLPSLSQEITSALSVSPQTVQNAGEVVRAFRIAQDLKTMGIKVPTEKVLADVAGQREKAPSAAAQITSGVQNTAAGLIGGLAEPEAAGAIAAAAVFPPIAPLVSAGFAAHMGSQVPELARAAGEASVTGTPYEKAKAYSDLAATTVLTPSVAVHAVSPLTRPTLTGEQIGELLGAEFRGPTGRGTLKFEAKKPDGSTSTGFAVNEGATAPEALAVYQELVDKYKTTDPANAPRPLPEKGGDVLEKAKEETRVLGKEESITGYTPEELESAITGEPPVEAFKPQPKFAIAPTGAPSTSGGTSPPTVPPGPTAAPVAPTPPPPGTTLSDVYQRFEPSPKTRTPIKEVVPKVVEAVRTGMASKFRPIDKLAEDIGKSYGATTPKNLSGIFEQLKGSTGRGEADIYRFDRDVSSKLKGSEKDFNAYMFLRRSLDRLNRDLEDIQRAQAGEEVTTLNRRSVAGYTIPELEAKLGLLESNLGPEKVQQFESSAQQYQAYMDNALRLQVESGRMSPEIYRAIKEGNEFYAPFKVMKYFEDIAQPEGSGRKIDTLADYTKAMVGIEDSAFKLGDMLGAARQNILISRILADKNNAMRKLAQLAEFDPNGVFIRRLSTGSEASKDLSAVNVKENGKTVQYAVNKEVAEAIQSMGPNTENILIQMMGYAAIPMKAGATSLNIPFQVSNLLADVPRQSLVSKYGLNSAADLVRYPMDFVRSAYAQIGGEVFKSDSRIFLDFLDSGAAGATVQEYLTPGALRFRPSGLEKTSKDFAKSVIYALPDFAKAIEQISKSVGVQRALREHGVTSGKELAAAFPEAITEIRRFSGSPDFGRQGKWVEQARLNLLYMFFNARLQGTIADLGRLSGRDGGRVAASTWTKLAAAVGTPTLYLYALNHSPEYKEDYLKRPEQERQNYWLIPKDTFITNEQGERIRDYWRIPKRESAKWLANFTESALNFYNQRNPEQLGNWMEAALTDIAPVNIHGDTLQERMESMASSLNPVMKAPIELATGRDLYRHRDIVPQSMQKASPEQQYIERTPDIFRQLAQTMPDVAPEVFRSPMMLENMVKNFTAGMITQFLPRKPIEGRSGLENNPLLQRFQAVPYTDSSEFDNRMKLLEREAADVQLKRFRDASEIFDANKHGTLQAMMDDARKRYGIDPKLFERIIDLYVAEKRGITSQERRILSLPVQQRAQFIADEIRGLTPEEKTNLIRHYAGKRILTEDVAAELIKLSQPQ